MCIFSFSLPTFCILEGEGIEKVRSVASGASTGAREGKINGVSLVGVPPGSTIFGSVFISQKVG